LTNGSSPGQVGIETLAKMGSSYNISSFEGGVLNYYYVVIIPDDQSFYAPKFNFSFNIAPTDYVSSVKKLSNVISGN